MNQNWSDFLDGFGKRMLEELGEDASYLSGEYNPITQALKNDPEFVTKYKGLKGFNRKGLSRVATICQMAVFDRQDGPERDSKCKALRRHWYSWYKQFAQNLSGQIDEEFSPIRHKESSRVTYTLQTIGQRPGGHSPIKQGQIVSLSLSRKKWQTRSPR